MQLPYSVNMQKGVPVAPPLTYCLRTSRLPRRGTWGRVGADLASFPLTMWSPLEEGGSIGLCGRRSFATCIALIVDFGKLTSTSSARTHWPKGD